MRYAIIAAALALAGCGGGSPPPVEGTPNADMARRICVENGNALGSEGFHRCFESTYAAIMGRQHQAVRRAPISCYTVGNSTFCD